MFVFLVKLPQFYFDIRAIYQIFRHGDSNIEKVYPNDPFKDESYWPEGYGELTNVTFQIGLF